MCKFPGQRQTPSHSSDLSDRSSDNTTRPPGNAAHAVFIKIFTCPGQGTEGIRRMHMRSKVVHLTHTKSFNKKLHISSVICIFLYVSAAAFYVRMRVKVRRVEFIRAVLQIVALLTVPKSEFPSRAVNNCARLLSCTTSN